VGEEGPGKPALPLGERTGRATLDEMKRILVVVLTAATLVAVSVATAAPATVVRGVVMRGPATPVCTEGRPCSVPLADRAVVFSQGRSEVARAATNQLGRFAVRLAPGTYGVRVAGQSRLARLSPNVVHVRSSGLMWIRLDLDTGIRRPGPPVGD
jgi:hypothetical protein